MSSVVNRSQLWNNSSYLSRTSYTDTNRHWTASNHQQVPPPFLNKSWAFMVNSPSRQGRILTLDDEAVTGVQGREDIGLASPFAPFESAVVSTLKS